MIVKAGRLYKSNPAFSAHPKYNGIRCDMTGVNMAYGITNNQIFGKLRKLEKEIEAMKKTMNETHAIASKVQSDVASLKEALLSTVKQ